METGDARLRGSAGRAGRPRSRSPPTWGWASRWSTCCGRGGSPRGWASASASTTDERAALVLRRDCWPGSAASPTRPRWRPGSATTSPSARDSYEVDLAGLPMLGFMLRHVGAGSPALHRLRLGADAGRSPVAQAIERGLLSHCLTTALMADDSGSAPTCASRCSRSSPAGTARACPPASAASEIALSMPAVPPRRHRRGVPPARRRRRRRRGGAGTARRSSSIPTSSTRSAATPTTCSPNSTTQTDWHALIDSEPRLQHAPHRARARRRARGGRRLHRPARRRHRAGHSRGVADAGGRGGRQRRAARGRGRDCLRRAGLVHDVGLHGIPATILDKPGPLTADRVGADADAPVLHRTDAGPAAGAGPDRAIAALAHERLDGSGYHRGLSGPAIPRDRPAARPPPCAYRAMTEPRPHRPAMSRQAGRRGAARRGARRAPRRRRGRRRAGGGRPAPRASDAAGRPGSRPRDRGAHADRPRCLQPAGRRSSSASPRRPPSTHIERIYTKTGASTRSTATLFAMQHGLLDALEPLDL